MSISPLSRTVAHAVSNYASQEGLTMDSLRENAPQHAGNLRAELMQTTGNTQLFTNQFVDDLLGSLAGGAPQLDVIDKVVSGVIAQHEQRMQQVNAGMGDTLRASQSMGTGQRNMSGSPLMTQMAAMTETAAPNMTDAGASAGVQNPIDHSGAAIGQQGASWGKKAIKTLRTGAIVLGLSAAAMTGFLGINHYNNTPDFQNPAPIELIQDQQQSPVQSGVEVVTPAPAQQNDGAFGPGAGQVENDKEAAHNEFLQNGGNSGGATQTTPPPATDTAPPPAADNTPNVATPNDKEQAHETTFGPASTDGGGGGSVTTPVDTEGEGVSPAPVGSDEGVRSFNN